MRRHFSTLAYLVLAVGLLCYLTFIDKKIPGTKAREEADTELFKFQPDQVDQLEIYNVHGGFFFQKKDNHWEIRQPVATVADTGAVTEIINAIAFAQPEGSRPVDKNSDANLKEWGLAPPAERVVIKAAGKTYELLIGRKLAINDSVWSRASGRKDAPVRVIPNSIKALLQKDLSDFRSRNIFDFDTEKATRINMKIANLAASPAQECEIDYKDEKWMLQKPLVARAAEQSVQALLTKILAQRAVDFVTDTASNLSQYGLTSPSATLAVSTKPDEETVLQIGGAVPGKPDQVYAQRLASNSVFTMTKTAVDELLQAVPNVRDRHVFPFDPGKATALSFTFANKKVSLRKDKGVWNTQGDSAGMADVGKVTDLLARLSDLETTPLLKDSTPDLKPFGLDQPQGKITVESLDLKSNPVLTLLIGKTENQIIYVRNSSEPFIYTVPAGSFDFLPSANLEMRDARAVNLTFKEVKTMTFAAPSTPPVVLTRSAGGTWTAVNIKDRMVDGNKADLQASLVSRLNVKKWLGPILPAYGLNKPSLTVTVQADQPKPTVLVIGAGLPDGSHAAQIEGSPVAFEIDDGDFGELNTSSLQAIPREVSGTNAPPVSPVAPSTNAPPASSSVVPSK